MKEKYLLTFLPTEDTEEETIKREALAAELAYQQAQAQEQEPAPTAKPKHYVIDIYEYKPVKVEPQQNHEPAPGATLQQQPQIEQMPQSVAHKVKSREPDPDKNYNDLEYWKSIKPGSSDLIEGIENGWITNPDILPIYFQKGIEHTMRHHRGKPNEEKIRSSYKPYFQAAKGDTNIILSLCKEEAQYYTTNHDYSAHPDAEKQAINILRLAASYAEKHPTPPAPTGKAA